MEQIKEKLEYLRGELRAETISYGELFELQVLIPYIEKDDLELLEAAGVTETENEMTNETVFTITAKSRNLSLSHTNKPTGNGTEISTPPAPKTRGGLASVKRELAECQKMNSGGTYYNVSLFVCGKRVTEIYDPMHNRWVGWIAVGIREVLDMIESYGDVMVATE